VKEVLPGPGGGFWKIPPSGGLPYITIPPILLSLSTNAFPTLVVGNYSRQPAQYG